MEDHLVQSCLKSECLNQCSTNFHKVNRFHRLHKIFNRSTIKVTDNKEKHVKNIIFIYDRK